MTTTPGNVLAGSQGKIDQATVESPFLPFPLPLPPLEKFEKRVYAGGGNKWWPTFSFVRSFFLSALTDWRLSSSSARSLLALSAA